MIRRTLFLSILGFILASSSGVYGGGADELGSPREADGFMLVDMMGTVEGLEKFVHLNPTAEPLFPGQSLGSFLIYNRDIQIGRMAAAMEVLEHIRSVPKLIEIIHDIENLFSVNILSKPLFEGLTSALHTMAYLNFWYILSISYFSNTKAESYSYYATILDQVMAQVFLLLILQERIYIGDIESIVNNIDIVRRKILYCTAKYTGNIITQAVKLNHMPEPMQYITP